VSASSDLYALGVMAYELLTGTRPFDGPDYLGPKMRGEFAAVTSKRPGLPAKLDAFFASALAADPARRPRDAAAFAAAFSACW
jgi:serine/threonine protein kinase